MRGEYSVGFIAYKVCRGRGRGRDEIEGVHRIELPALPVPAPIPGDTGHKNMVLRMYFLSELDASEAMKNPDFQTLSIRAAEEYWDIFDAVIGTRRIEHVLRVKPVRLIPGLICCSYDAKLYHVPVMSEQKPPAPIKQPDYRDEVEPLSFQQTAHSSYPACEYDVSYYAAYCDDEKMWEVCPEKGLYTIGGTRYPFPGNE